MSGPEIPAMHRADGAAGQFAVHVKVQHVGETDPTRVAFVGSVYGGPVVMTTPNGIECHVTAPDRFGQFSRDPRGWVRRF